MIRFLLAFSAIGLSIVGSNVLAWTINATFDDGPEGASAQKNSDSFHGAAGRSEYDTERFFEGGQAAKLSILEGEEGYGWWGGEFLFPENATKGDELWMRVYTYFPSGFDYYSYSAGGRLKFLRFGTLSASGDNQGYNDLYIDMPGSSNPFKWIFEGRGNWTDIGEPEHLPKFDVWESYEIYVKLDNASLDDGGNAVIRIWKDGFLLNEITDRTTLKDADSYSNRALIFTYWNGGAPRTQSMWVDNIVITTDEPANKDGKGNAYVGSNVDAYRGRKPVMTAPTVVIE